MEMKKNIKRGIVAIICVFAILFTLCFQGVFALVSSEASQKYSSYVAPKGDLSKFETIGKCILSGIKNCQKEIDVSSCNFSLDSIDELKAYVYFDMPEAFHITNLSYTSDNKTNCVCTLIPTYKLNSAEYNKVSSAISEIANRLVADIKSSTLPDAEKVLLVHDCLANLCAINRKDNMIIGNYNANLVGVFLNKQATSMGYAATFNYLISMIGMKSYTCFSNAAERAWNIVYVDGVKYHCDVAYDKFSEQTEAYGSFTHDFVLKSTSLMTKSCGDATDFDQSPDSDTYDNYFWRYSITEFQYLNGKIYFTDCVKEKIYSYEPPYSESALKIVRDLSEENWKLNGTLSGGSKYDCTSFLSNNGTKICYTMKKAVYSIEGESPDDINKDTLIYSVPTDKSLYIAGFKCYNGKYLINLNYSVINFASASSKAEENITYDENAPTDATLKSLGITDEQVTQTSSESKTKEKEEISNASGKEITDNSKENDKSSSSSSSTVNKTSSEIKGYKQRASVSYKTTCTFSCVNKNLPSNAEIQWYVNGKYSKSGNSYTVVKATADFTLQCKAVQNGNIIAESQTEKIDVDTGFISRFIAFFKEIFGKLPSYTQ